HAKFPSEIRAYFLQIQGCSSPVRSPSEELECRVTGKQFRIMGWVVSRASIPRSTMEQMVIYYLYEYTRRNVFHSGKWTAFIHTIFGIIEALISRFSGINTEREKEKSVLSGSSSPSEIRGCISLKFKGCGSQSDLSSAGNWNTKYKEKQLNGGLRWWRNKWLRSGLRSR
ncbi:hypothetical protein CEXT_615641, partial [Caerostris extrusa]